MASKDSITAAHMNSPASKDIGGRILQRLLARIKYGQLIIITPSGAKVESHVRHGEIKAILHLHRWRSILSLLTKGDLGFAQAYIEGDWSSPDLTALLFLLAQNITALSNLIKGITFLRLPARRQHYARRNTLRKSRKNILEHYDLGNGFYRLWLDESMTYSSAYGMREGKILEAAQSQKRDLVANLLAVTSGSNVLEIGCGWGALAVALAEAGAHVTGITLSDAQCEMAKNLAAASSAKAHIDVRLQDYRDLNTAYDRIVSIEMIEAVGEAYWPVYFQKLSDCLKPGGRIVLQAITIHEDHYDNYRRNTDFIQRYIFPGGMLPSKEILEDQANKAGLKKVQHIAFGQDYAHTLLAWKTRFLEQWAAIEKFGFDIEFKRRWSYYFSYCAAGFQAGILDVGLYVFEPQ